MYDENGNMIKDRNKGINTITYNHLNLPVEIKWTNNKKINYLYTATGVKVQKTVTNGANIKTTDYLDGFQYNNDVLEFFPHPEGYVKATLLNPNNNKYAYNYVYNYTDHLGNVRVSYTKDPQTGKLKILDESHYYPFGLKHSEYAKYGLIGQNLEVIIAPVADNPFKYRYNSKEWQDELGLSWYDYGARNYDPAIGRWMNHDPLAEVSRRWSPYAYAYNNPLRFIDSDGMKADDIIIENTSKKTLTRVKDGSVTDTWVKDGVTTETGLSKEQTEGRIAMTTHDDSEWQSNEVSIIFSDSKSVNRETVSDYTISVLVDNMNETGETSIQINSTMRTPEDQARIMSDLVKTGGMAEQKKLYGPNGRAVLDKYPDQKAMVNKINEIGPDKVSNHLGDPSKINVVDISRYSGGIKNPKGFSEKLSSDKRVQRVLSPWNSKDKAIHTEVPQP